MGLFDINIQEKMKLKNDNQNFFNFIEKRVSKIKEYKITKDMNTINIQKCHFDTLLKYDTKIVITKNQNEKNIKIDAQLADTLILTILIILAILFTYGIGAAFVALYAYLQKKKANLYIENLIKDYKTIT